MISTPKTGHFRSLFYAFFDKNLPKCGKIGGGECRFWRFLPCRKAPSLCYLHPMELPVPCHGTNSSMAWRKRFTATFRPLASRQSTPSAITSRDFSQLAKVELFVTVALKKMANNKQKRAEKGNFGAKKWPEVISFKGCYHLLTHTMSED